MTQALLNLGSQPGDGTGTKGQPGGQIINNNFSELFNNAVYIGGETGTLNSYVINSVLPNPANFVLDPGTAVIFSPNTTNTGPATLNLIGTGPYPINYNGVHLSGGEIAFSTFAIVVYYGGFWSLVNSAANSQAYGVYTPAFQAGYVQYCGPSNTFAGNTRFVFGLALPNPSGSPATGLLLGSGSDTQAWIITDQALTNTTPGINLGITAGETQAAGTANGGVLELYGGASYGGTGGATQIYGGTSLNGPGGSCLLAGGNSTNGIPGDLFLIGGQAGTRGASVHVIMTTIGGLSGFFRIRNNSTVLYEFDAAGQIFIGASGAGLAGQPLVSGGPGASTQWLSTGFTGTITTAKLTSGGNNGSMTFASGILTGQVQAT